MACRRSYYREDIGNWVVQNDRVGCEEVGLKARGRSLRGAFIRRSAFSEMGSSSLVRAKDKFGTHWNNDMRLSSDSLRAISQSCSSRQLLLLNLWRTRAATTLITTKIQRIPELLMILAQLLIMYEENRLTSSREDFSDEDPSRRESRKSYAVAGDVSW